MGATQLKPYPCPAQSSFRGGYARRYAVVNLWDATESFLALRRLSGRPVGLYADVLCHICHAHFTGQHELKKLLVENHLYRIYCGDFECKPEHLAGRHPTALDIFGPFTKLQAPFG
jgi:hypothetical protein